MGHRLNDVKIQTELITVPEEANYILYCVDMFGP